MSGKCAVQSLYNVPMLSTESDIIAIKWNWQRYTVEQSKTMNVGRGKQLKEYLLCNQIDKHSFDSCILTTPRCFVGCRDFRCHRHSFEYTFRTVTFNYRHHHYYYVHFQYREIIARESRIHYISYKKKKKLYQERNKSVFRNHRSIDLNCLFEG